VKWLFVDEEIISVLDPYIHLLLVCLAYRAI